MSPLTSERAREIGVLSSAKRQRAAEVKRHLRTGQLTLAEVLDEVPPELGSMSTWSFVKSTRGVGPARADRILIKAGECCARRLFAVQVGRLTRWERDALLTAFATLYPTVAGVR